MKKNLKNLVKSLRTKIGVFLGEKQRSIEREIDGNEKQITQRLYIGKPVILDRCRYRGICWGGVEKILVDSWGVEEVSRINTPTFRTKARSIHQVSRGKRDYDKKKLKEARQIASYRGGVEPAFKNSFSRCEKHKHECNPNKHTHTHILNKSNQFYISKTSLDSLVSIH